MASMHWVSHLERQQEVAFQAADLSSSEGGAWFLQCWQVPGVHDQVSAKAALLNASFH
jgi:hypothetical protein